jgi:hypothetical protein
MGIAEQQRQFDAVHKLLSPFADAGTQSLSQQKDLIGVNGRESQQNAIDALKNGAQYQSLIKTGENSILANASATGGLRGGNTQSALAQFSPSVLNALINDQYSKLGGLTSIGQNAAAGVGNAGMQTGNQITSLLGQIGSAGAGNALAQGNAAAGFGNAFTRGLGAYVGMGGNFGSGSTGFSGIDPNGVLANLSSTGYVRAGGDFSDIRLKTDIEPLGLDDNGLMLYAFRYIWGGAKHLGHMAHEVIAKFPDAVSKHASGFLMVDYSKV